ncbi:pseudouridine synthase [Corynebacterium timonense]|uniref:RNA pseudouridylate synthase n=1 Tax=Corynebacterium timonense TaxID=441500 RepID=A0A1H1UVA6_9CORY|nr:pseudouridine synthase [Corynebacterium timonense]SDS76452.1 tRNA pseudouridine32 synthase / 23S rRNA pseudouridine746 synthase [Corynebacterium timonense]
MARRKAKNAPPLPPRGGLGASRVRLPGPEPLEAFEFLTLVIGQQRHRHPDDDAAAIRDRFAVGEVVLRDGTPLAPTTVIAPGTDVFFYRRPAPEIPVPFDIETIYEDDAILVVRKPPFLATMPRAAHITETATVRLRRATGNEELTPAHRLDRLTTGLLLLTKRRDIRGAYQQLFASRSVHKLYEAIGADTGLRAPARWEHHLVKNPGQVAAHLIEGATPNSVTFVRDVTPLPPDPLWGAGAARYLLEPITGKTHQLRVHMNAAGAPIINDSVYPRILPFGHEDFTAPMLLCAVGLEFTDPLNGQHRRFSTPGYAADHYALGLEYGG